MPAVNWENASVFEKRTAHLLPALLLARVDGKSPVEYLTTPAQRAVVRRAAMQGLQSSPLDLNQFLEITLKALSI